MQPLWPPIFLYHKANSRTGMLFNSFSTAVIISLKLSTPHLPRIPDAGDRTGLRWRGCHNTAASFVACATGFPPSLWRAVRSIFKAPAQSSRRICHHPGYRVVDRSETACPSPPGCSIFAASCTRSYAGYVPVLPCIQLSKDSERKNSFLITMTKKGSLSCL